MSKNNIRLRIATIENGERDFKAIIGHPMETGFRIDNKSRQKIPADYIEDFQVSVDGEIYFEMVMGVYVSKNPFVSFTFAKQLVDNQAVKVSWIDNSKNEISYEFLLDFKQGSSFRYTGEKKGSDPYQLLPQAGPVCNTQRRH